MPTYLISREITITRQEGDVADIVVTVPDILPLTDRIVKFQVRDTNNKLVFVKSDSEITINMQTITIPILPVDTAHKAGKHFWELEVSDSDGPVTIGHGVFIIIKTMIQ